MKYGLLGAAMNSLLMGITNFIQHYIAIKKLFSDKIVFAKLLWKPVISSICMAGYILYIRDHGLILSIIPAAIIYFVAFFSLTALSVGGFRRLREEYIHMISE